MTSCYFNEMVTMASIEAIGPTDKGIREMLFCLLLDTGIIVSLDDTSCAAQERCGVGLTD